MLKINNIDETSSSAPDIIQRFNGEWTVDDVIERKEIFLEQILDTLQFDTGSGPQNPYDGLGEMIEEEFEDRYNFNSVR
jgi:hypothetical protein